MNVKSYLGKEFVITSGESVIRDENLAPVKYKLGDDIPPGSNVGDTKKIPKGTVKKVVAPPTKKGAAAKAAAPAAAKAAAPAAAKAAPAAAAAPAKK